MDTSSSGPGGGTAESKPPDITNIGMDASAANLLQFAASVSVPECGVNTSAAAGSLSAATTTMSAVPTSNVFDLGLESFQSLYEDLGELIPSAVTTTVVSNNNNN